MFGVERKQFGAGRKSVYEIDPRAPCLVTGKSCVPLIDVYAIKAPYKMDVPTLSTFLSPILTVASL